MKNYEKYKDLVIDCVKKDVSCALEEYTPKIDWSKVPVDTPVICTDHRGKKFNRHFSGYENGSIAVFSYGATSWSSDGFDSVWKIDEVELAREEDVEKYSI